MRHTVLEYYARNASAQQPLHILTADLGYGLFAQDWEQFPHVLCTNVGVAEQNMIGIAAGISLSGTTVICYSMASFLSLRAAEQIRIDICLDKRNVVLIGAGSGVSCGLEGPTHHALEDIAVLGAFPNLTIFCPSNRVELLRGLHLLGNRHGPVYIRIGVESPDSDAFPPPQATIGGIEIIRSGVDVLLLSHGNALSCAKEAASLLQERGISCTVAGCPWLRPFDSDALVAVAAEHQIVIVVEEHSKHGGLAALVAACLIRVSRGPRLLSFCVEPGPSDIVGTHRELLAMNGLAPDAICCAALKALQATSGG